MLNQIKYIDWEDYPWCDLKYRTHGGKRYVLCSKLTCLKRSDADQSAARIRGCGGLARVTCDGALKQIWANPNGSNSAYLQIYCAVPDRLESSEGIYWVKDQGWR